MGEVGGRIAGPVFTDHDKQKNRKKKGQVRKHIHLNTKGNGRLGKEIEILSGSSFVQSWNTGSLIGEHKDSDAENVTDFSSLGVWCMAFLRNMDSPLLTPTPNTVHTHTSQYPLILTRRRRLFCGT